MSGVRSVKIADGLRHEYVTQNGRVVRESVYGLNSNTGEYTVFQYALDFLYDESGHPFLMRRYYNEAQTNYNTYHYVLNAQGDVIKLLHGSNTTVAEYSYDAWGNILSATGSLANVNPLRYRGYYYDTETGFYYLQSRYYDPIIKRFLNADSYASTGQGFVGHNMFAYCGNEPVNGCDSSGLLRTRVERIDDFYGSAPDPAAFATQKSYKSENEAAIAGGNVAALYSRTYNREYAFGIYKEGGMCRLTEMFEGEYDHISSLAIEKMINSGSKAIVHSHPNIIGLSGNSFSVWTVKDNQKQLAGDAYISNYYTIKIYLAAPNGELKSLFVRSLTPDGLPKDRPVLICDGLISDPFPIQLGGGG